jgi:hypothetical protein
MARRWFDALQARLDCLRPAGKRDRPDVVPPPS